MMEKTWWRHFPEEKPEMHVEVIVYVPGKIGITTSCIYSDGEWGLGNDIEWWMPIPTLLSGEKVQEVE